MNADTKILFKTSVKSILLRDLQNYKLYSNRKNLKQCTKTFSKKLILTITYVYYKFFILSEMEFDT